MLLDIQGETVQHDQAAIVLIGLVDLNECHGNIPFAIRLLLQSEG
jgi:hypothetical protein